MAGANDPDLGADETALRVHAGALAEAAAGVVSRWIERCVLDRVAAGGLVVDDSVRAVAGAAGAAAEADVVPRLRELLAADIDEQRSTPLALLRGATAYATRALHDLGISPVLRDDFDARSFPDDDYGLVPASLADVDPALHEPGLVWGAAKAYVHLARRRAEGRR
ncbi:MAG: hypothetical protein KDB21_05565 [Acidimicrobiales bacterium]|nr:hypothetical protein [Acidimicrobiales bacterium]